MDDVAFRVDPYQSVTYPFRRRYRRFMYTNTDLDPGLFGRALKTKYEWRLGSWLA